MVDISIQDYVVAGDLANRSVATVRAATDSIAASDLTERSLITLREFEDFIGVLDSVSVNTFFLTSGTLFDTVSVSDAVDRSVDYSRSAADVVVVADDLFVEQFNFMIADALTVTDVAFRETLQDERALINTATGSILAYTEWESGTWETSSNFPVFDATTMSDEVISGGSFVQGVKRFYHKLVAGVITEMTSPEKDAVDDSSAVASFSGEIERGLQPYVLSSLTADANPGSGFFRLNNSDQSLVTEIFVSKVTQCGTDLEELLLSMQEDTFVAIAQEHQAGVVDFLLRITDEPVDATRYVKWPVVVVTQTNTLIVDAPADLSIVWEQRFGTGRRTGSQAFIETTSATFADTTAFVDLDDVTADWRIEWAFLADNSNTNGSWSKRIFNDTDAVDLQVVNESLETKDVGNMLNQHASLDFSTTAGGGVKRIIFQVGQLGNGTATFREIQLTAYKVPS